MHYCFYIYPVVSNQLVPNFTVVFRNHFNQLIMKKFLVFISGLMLSIGCLAQESQVDTVAVMIIDRMATVIGDLNSCSFTLNTSADVKDPDLGLVKQNGKADVYLVGPDKMYLDSKGEKGHRGFWYNGTQAFYYSFDENNYAYIDVPDNLIAMIDSVNKNYGIEFPAADFFYPTFTEDVLSAFNNIRFLGKKNMGDKECLHILLSNDNMSVQVWFSSDAFTLPQKFVIIYKNDGNRQYEATFSNFKLNPEFPDAIFDFMPPPMAREISILPRNSK